MIPFDTYVVDPHDSYRVLSGFAVTSGGVPVLNGGGVSLEADCLGPAVALRHLSGRAFSRSSPARPAGA